MLPQVKIASTPLAYQSGVLQSLPHSWGSLSRVIKGLGGMIKSLQNLEVSFWPLVHSGHHCPHDPFKIRELGCPTLHTKGGSEVFGSGSRGTKQFLSHPIRDPHLLHPLHPWGPPSVHQDAQTRPWQGSTTGAWWLLSLNLGQGNQSLRHKSLALPLGLACWEKPTLSFKSPPIMKTELKLTSPHPACHLSWQALMAFAFKKKQCK